MIPNTIFNDIIEEIAGKDVISLVDLIKGKSLVSEFKIAEKMAMTVNHVRNMLYKLDAYSLVESARKKDKNKGWYVYYWTLDLNKLRDLAVKLKQEKIDSLKARIEKEESGTFFVCPDKHIRMSLENAMESKFRCTECDLPMKKDDNLKVITSLKKQIEKLTKEVNALKELNIKPVSERKLVRKPSEKKAVKKKAREIVKKEEKSAKNKSSRKTIKRKSTKKKKLSGRFFKRRKR